MKCPHCNQEHPNAARFCPNTGDLIVAYECPNCGQVVTAGVAFCSYCGYALFDPAAAAPAGAPARRAQRAPRVALIAVGAILVAAFIFFVVWQLLTSLFTGGSHSNSPAGQFPNLDATLTVLAGQAGKTQQPAPGGAPTATLDAGLSLSPTPAPPTATAGPAAGNSPPACSEIGQSWTRPQDGAQMVCVPAGAFVIGMQKCEFVGCAKEVNGGSVALDAFWIDVSEVTNAAYTQFVTAAGYTTGAEKTGASEVNGLPRAVTGADWRHPQGPDSSITELTTHPVVQLNWYDAAAFCQWAGARLPTEAQWEKAARGTDGRLFPWGSDMPKDSLLNAADSSLPVAWARPDQNDGYRYTAPAGSYPAGNSPYGVEDLAGNAWEWTRSLYRDYPYQAGDGREIQGQAPAGDKVSLRGGSWYNDYGSVRSTLRYPSAPALANDTTGFRCVYP